MKKFLILVLSIVLLTSMILCSCGEPEETGPTGTTQATTPTHELKPLPSVAETTPSAEEPQYGGILKAIVSPMNLPKVLGYPVEGSCRLAPCTESFVCVDGEGNILPELAESWEYTSDGMAFIYHLRKGVKFHDMTDWNAEAAKWNMDTQIKAGRVRNASIYIESLETPDDYTLKINLTQAYPSAILPFMFSWPLGMVSPTAVNENGADWARVNPVGTGPFKFKEFQRDTYIKYERFDSYWRQGLPYMDGVEFWVITDPVTASAAYQAGEYDIWTNMSQIKDYMDLVAMGFSGRYVDNMISIIAFDTRNTDSIFTDKRIREAVEYAIDRPGIAMTIGFGYAQPVNQNSFEGAPCYNADYPGRPYNPEKAKQLLTEAGYPEGFKTTIICESPAYWRDQAAAIQASLAQVGIEADLDIADAARFNDLKTETGWNNAMLLTSWSIGPPYPDAFLFNFEPERIWFKSMERSPEFAALCNQTNEAETLDEYFALCTKAIKQQAEDADCISLWTGASAYMVYPYFHTDYFDQHSVMWWMYDDWLEVDKQPKR